MRGFLRMAEMGVIKHKQHSEEQRATTPGTKHSIICLLALALNQNKHMRPGIRTVLDMVIHLF